jgi:signal transduction histidine kinase
MLAGRSSVLSTLLATSITVTAVLLWFGLRSLDQERAVERQRQRERMESAADAIAATVRGRLAEAGERLTTWISNPGSPLPRQDDAVVIGAAEGQIQVVPRGALPFLPSMADVVPSDKVFAEVEAIEFAGTQLALAAEKYRALTRNANARIRAEALLRLGRVLRRMRSFDDAAPVYESLAQMNDVLARGLPAELAGMEGQRLIRTAVGDHAGEKRIAAQMADFIDSGRWLLARGSAEYYRDVVTQAPKPESWSLAEAFDGIWETETKAGSSSNVRMVQIGDRQVLVIWRSNGRRSAALASFAERFLIPNAPNGVAYQLTDAAGRRIAGSPSPPPSTAARIVGDPLNPWMLRIWFGGAVVPGARNWGSQLLLAMLITVMVFLWATVYFMVRAIRRETQVARLQSDFVAAVSHEFRSPLTTVGQLSEMLEMDQVPSEDRRRKYYHLLAGEARRLQRLVETLLDFGRMEAGAEKYRFEPVEVRAVVDRAVREASGEEIQPAERVRVMGRDPSPRVIGDPDALALALRNLVENGLKYSPSPEPVEVTWTNENGRVLITVADHGPGIPRDEQAAIFQKFVRGRSAIRASIKGTGLGLAMARRILTAHGGEVRLESEPGHGSIFTIVLAEAS